MPAATGWVVLAVLHLILVAVLLYGLTRLAHLANPVLNFFAVIGRQLRGAAAAPVTAKPFPVRYVPRLFVT
jgi:hypothetical protein